MGKIYNQKTIGLLQKAIDDNVATFERQEYGFTKKVYIAGVRIELLTDGNGRRDSLFNIVNNTIDNNYMAIWRTFAPGHFLGRDFKKNTLDAEGQCPYFIVKATLNEVPVRAILRELFEDDQKQKMQYTDIKKDDKFYTIIKMCLDTLPEIDEETGEEIHDGCEWLPGKDKVADIMHATELDAVPGLEMSKKHQEVVDGDDDISSAVFEAEMMSTYF